MPWRDPAGTCPWEGLQHPPGAGSCESPAYAGVAPLPQPCAGPALPEELPLGPLPCLGVFEPADDSDLRSPDLFTEPGQSGRSVRRHGWHCGGRVVPSVPPACHWLCHQLPCSCRGQRGMAAPLAEGRDVPGLALGRARGAAPQLVAVPPPGSISPAAAFALAQAGCCAAPPVPVPGCARVPRPALVAGSWHASPACLAGGAHAAGVFWEQSHFSACVAEQLSKQRKSPQAEQ